MGPYTYEIIGGILIVLSSLVGEQMKREWKVRFYVIFAGIAITYTGIGVYLRRDADIKDGTDRQERKEEIKDVRRDISNIVASLKALETSKTMSPGAPAGGGVKATTPQHNVDSASKALFAVLADSLSRQLRSWRGDWSSPEGKEMISNVEFISRGLLQGGQPTPDDIANLTFLANVNGGSIPWDPERGARYLDSLVLRLGIPLPPRSISAVAR